MSEFPKLVSRRSFMVIMNAEVSVDTFFALRYEFLNHMISNEQLQHYTFFRICTKSNTTGATSGAEASYLSGTSKFTYVFKQCSRYLIFGFVCNVLQIVVCPIVFLFWPLYCLSFFDLRLIISLFGIFNFSYNDNGVVNLFIIVHSQRLQLTKRKIQIHRTL